MNTPRTYVMAMDIRTGDVIRHNEETETVRGVIRPEIGKTQSYSLRFASGRHAYAAWYDRFLLVQG